MLNQLDYSYWLSILICIICLFIMLAVEKLIHRPMHYISIFVMCFGVFLFQTQFVLVNFDANGNRYNFAEWQDGDYKKVIYYTEDGEAFTIQGDKMVNTKDSQNVFNINKTYLDENGNLVFDKENKYHKTWKTGVFTSTERKHVYSIAVSSWDALGNFRIPEAKRIKLGRYDISPCSLDIEDYGEYPGKLTFFLVECYEFISMGVYLFLLLIYIIKLVKSKSMKIAVYKWFEKMVTAGIVMFQALIIIGYTKSFLDLILRWITYVIVFYKVIPILQGGIEIEINSNDTENKSKKIFVRDMLQAVDERKVRKWRRQFIVASSISMICWIGISIVYSIQSSLYC